MTELQKGQQFPESVVPQAFPMGSPPPENRSSGRLTSEHWLSPALYFHSPQHFTMWFWKSSSGS